MIISQPVGLDQNETHKSAYFCDAMPSPLSLTASVPIVGHSSISGSSQGLYPPGDNYFLPSRVPADLSNMSMYVAQPETTSISSPGNYAGNPASVATAPGLMGTHYASGLQHTSCYPPLGEDYEMRPGVGGVWHGTYAQPPPSCYPYENNFGPQYHYDRYCGMDINDGVRRKNATRESTNTLKAWLQEHKKNPYPTKGEKIMLAIITKMTLTQVSTWFANARRRLKKENKMTWVPKNRSSDASNTGSKKTDDEDDDDVTSHLSQENESKSDNEHSIDSDDSDSRKVTSTNISDDVNATADLKDSSNDFSNERCSVTSDGAGHQPAENREFHSQQNDEQLRTNFAPYDHKDKTWSTVGDGTEQKTPERVNTQSISSPYPSNPGYLVPSTVLPQPHAHVNSTIGSSDEICPANEVKYPPEWTATTFAAYSSETSVTSQRSNGPLKTSQSPTHISETKPNISRNAFAINPSSGSASPSYLHGYHHSLPQHIDYYRSADRLGADQPYYPSNDINSRPELKSETIQGGTFPVNRDQIQPKTPSYSLNPSPTHSTSDSSSSNSKPLYQHNTSPQYFPNVKLNKPDPTTTTSYTGSFFHHDHFNQQTGNNVDYYQRKGFYTTEASSYHMPSSTSPRK